MKIIARFQRSTGQDLETWVQSLPGQEPERRALAQTVLSLLLRYLEQQDGKLPDAIREIGVEPPTWWWRFNRQFWIRFCVEDARRSRFAFWVKPTRKITIVRVSCDLPENLTLP